MARPIQTLLERRPVRNAVRALLGLQPRYGRGFGVEDEGTPAAQPSGVTPPADAGMADNATLKSQSGPVTGMAGAVAVPSNALAVAADSDLESGPRRLPGRQPPAPAQAGQTFGMYGSLPAGTPRPRTIEVPPPSVTGTQTPVLNAFPGTMSLAAPEENLFEAAENNFRPQRSVSQNPAQASVRAVPTSQPAETREAVVPAVAPAAGRQAPAQETTAAAAPPVDPRIAQAAMLSQQAQQIRSSLGPRMEQFYRQPNDMVFGLLTQQLSEATRLEAQAQALTDRVTAAHFAERRLGILERESRQKVPDTLANNVGDFTSVVQQQGLSTAVNAAVRQELAGLAGKGVTPTPEQVAQMTGQYASMGGAAVVADRIIKRQPFSLRDPFVAELANLAQQAHPQDAVARKRMVNGIVEAAGYRANLPPEKAQVISTLLSNMVEENLKGR